MVSAIIGLTLFFAGALALSPTFAQEDSSAKPANERGGQTSDQSASDAIEKAKEATNEAIEAAKRSVSEAIDRAKEFTQSAKPALDKASEAARDVLDNAKRATEDVLQKAKESVDRETSERAEPQEPARNWDMWNPGWMRRHMWGQGRMAPEVRSRMARHWTYMHQGIPAEYRGVRNPFAADAKTVSEGHTLYQENCASCHGPTGMGEGDAGRALNPSPALLAYMIQAPIAVDEYMLWTISEGGKQFDTDMPAFKNTLTKDEIWKIVTYMRAGFPLAQQDQ